MGDLFQQAQKEVDIKPNFDPKIFIIYVVTQKHEKVNAINLKEQDNSKVSNVLRDDWRMTGNTFIT